ncbi:hypothetical protein GCM10023114_52120 [Mycolicibacterium sediminis]|uniref:Uncharacterized protein n=1 Tax=Mycolicibacterium sediminis TaxID=1286180 RepID=A0A7I7QL82_9MYCO|nr:hypothetical protein MSEDJ_11300 [Mycolicibacterium sediminis]
MRNVSPLLSSAAIAEPEPRVTAVTVPIDRRTVALRRRLLGMGPSFLVGIGPDPLAR